MLLFRSRVVAYGLLSAVVGPALLAADTITAAGATFPFPLYSKWFQQYKDKTGIQINYQSIGSGGGIKQLTQGTVDFGASDKPMSDAQLAKVKIKPLHFPTVMGAVVPVFNVPGVTGDLKFTGAILAGIFMGTIKKWNDQAITNVNKGAKLPDEYIVVIVRSDASGTTFVFTDYLSKANAAWKSKVGADSAINWPTGLRAKGNEGVSGFVKQTPFSIGYVELNYARQQKMGYGSVQNLAGTFVKADLASVTAAAASAAQDMPADYRVSITNAPGADAYPISTYTWLLIPSRIQDQAKRKAISEFLTWMLTAGQKTAPLLDYAPLPKSVADREAKAVSSIQ
jgi:phosphate transport system substrate-binding protein